MSGGQTLARLYSELDGVERFRAVYLARARGDTAEADRLLDTCPRRDYTLNDLQFVRRSLVARDLATAFLSEAERHLATLELLAVLRGPVTALRALLVEVMTDVHDWLAEDLAELGGVPAIDEGAGDSGERGELWSDAPAGRYPIRAMRDLHDTAIGWLALLWEAFGAACRAEMGLEPDELLRATWAPLLDRLAPYRAEMEASPDRERPDWAAARAEWEALARDIWRIGVEGLQADDLG
jgi:hypothetical protein